MNTKAKADFLINFFYYSVIAAVIYFSFKFLTAYLFPFVIGVIIVYLLKKPSDFIAQKTKIKRSICAPILVALTYVLIVCLIGIIVGLCVDMIPAVTKRIPALIDTVEKGITELKNKIGYEEKSELQKLFSTSLNSVWTKISEVTSSYAASGIKSMPGILVSCIVTVVASCYIAKDYDVFKKFLKNLLKEKTYERIITVKSIITENIFKFAGGYLLLMLITFAELTVGLLVLRVDYAVLIALAISFVDLLPVLGTGTVMIPWGLIELIFGKTSLGIGLIVVYVLITLVRNFTEPKIIGEKIGVNPLLTLAAMFVGLKIAGIFGLIAVPITVIVIIDYYKLQMKEEKSQLQ